MLWRNTCHFIFVVAVVLSFICVNGVSGQKILRQRGFENYNAADKNSAFQASTDTVKVGKKSLAIFSEKRDEIHIADHGFETDNPVISVEFWVYIEKGKQSFAVNINAAEEVFDNNAGGPYIEWNDGVVRYHVHRGDPWRDIFDYAVNTWNYVRIVANFEKNVFDFYMGKSREKALASRPRRNLEFQDPPLGPHPRWFSIWAWAMTARGYIDDLIIYEGGKPINLAVEPAGKLTTRWGQLKRGQKVFYHQNNRPDVYRL